jgi:hypothetical protein
VINLPIEVFRSGFDSYCSCMAALKMAKSFASESNIHRWPSASPTNVRIPYLSAVLRRPVTKAMPLLSESPLLLRDSVASWSYTGTSQPLSQRGDYASA